MLEKELEYLRKRLLEFFKDQASHKIYEAKDFVIKIIESQNLNSLKPKLISEEEVFSLIKILYKFHLKLGNLKEIKPGWYKITSKGDQLIPKKIAKTAKPKTPEVVARVDAVTLKKETVLEYVNQHRQYLKKEMLSRIYRLSPEFFEKLTIELLAHMGYAGNFMSSKTVSPTGPDGGIDGFLSKDRLGMDKVYLQAKRWKNQVGRPEVAQFVGDLQAFNAQKGVFITTSDFSLNAKDYVRKIQTKIALINGNDLVEYMLEYNLGVNIINTITIQSLQDDFFNEKSL